MRHVGSGFYIYESREEERGMNHKAGLIGLALATIVATAAVVALVVWLSSESEPFIYTLF